MREETGLVLVDLVGVAIDLLLPQLGDYISIAKELRDRNKYNNDTLNIIDKAKTSGGLTEEMYQALHDNSNGSTLIEFDLISTAIKTNKWVNYAIWCMTDDNSVLLKADKDARELVNAISMIAGFGRIYQSSGVVDLNKYDIANKDREVGSKFLLSIEDLKKRFEDEEFRKAMRYKLAKINAEINKNLIPASTNFFGTPARVDNDGLIHPIFFSNSSLREVMGPKQGDLPKELFDRLDAALAPMITDAKYKYSYEASSHLPLLTIERNNSYGATESFLLDDGTIMGGSTISILGTYRTVNGNFDFIFVDVMKLPHIAFSIINRSFYQLTPDEVAEAFSVMLQNYSIYNIIDFSNTPWFDYMTDNEKVALTKHLSDIIGFMHQDAGIYFSPRLRFTEYINPDNFGLISDNQVKSPLKDRGFTSPEICEGLSFRCTNGMMTQYFYNIPNASTTNQGGGYL